MKQEELVKDSSYKANWANAPPVGSCGLLACMFSESAMKRLRFRPRNHHFDIILIIFEPFSMVVT